MAGKIIEFKTNDKCIEEFDKAAFIVAHKFLDATEKLRHKGKTRRLKKMFVFNEESEYSLSVKDCIFSRKSFQSRVDILHGLIKLYGFFQFPISCTFAMGIAFVGNKETYLSQVATLSDEADEVLESVFNGLEKAGYGEFNPPEGMIQGSQKKRNSNELSEEAKAYLAQPSACYF